MPDTVEEKLWVFRAEYVIFVPLKRFCSTTNYYYLELFQIHFFADALGLCSLSFVYWRDKFIYDFTVQLLNSA